MKIAITIPSAGAGKWCWTGWSNAFKALGHEVENINGSWYIPEDTDLLICSTSSPQQKFVEWRQRNPGKKVALNVLAWTDANIPGINNAGVQASPNNVEYAKALSPNIVFAQYSKQSREVLLNKWHNEQGFRLGSMEMAADSTIYHYTKPLGEGQEIYYAGGYWPYKAQIIDKYLIPVLHKYRNHTVVGQGWQPFVRRSYESNEGVIGEQFALAKVCPNVHEPHSHYFEDIVERVFKVMYCGGLLVTDNAVGLENFGIKNGVHCMIGKTPKEYFEIIDDAIACPERYEAVRQQGRKLVEDKHTYIHRVTTLLKDLGDF